MTRKSRFVWMSILAAAASIAIWVAVLGLQIVQMLFGDSALSRWLVWVLIIASPLCLLFLLHRHAAAGKGD